MSPFKPLGAFKVSKVTTSVKEKGQRAGSKLTIKIEHTQCGRSFEFIRKGTHLEVIPGKEVRAKDGSGNVSANWYKVLTEEERLAVMQLIAAEYRKPSQDPDGVKTSAIGVVPNPDPRAPDQRDHYLIYVGINNHLNSADNYKSCAEQGMVRAASNSLLQHLYHERGQTLPDAPFIQDVYIMGGRDPDPSRRSDRGVPALCPCGQCTDLLAKTVYPKGNIYVMPYSNGLVPQKINDTAVEYSDVKIRSGEVWKTTIENLNRHRVITCSEPDLQKQGLDALVQQLMHYEPPPFSEEVLAKTLENKKQRRDSIPELDVATHNGQLSPVAANKYLLEQLTLTLEDRREAAEIPREEYAIRHWLENGDAMPKNKRVKYVRCTLMQLDDGSYCAGYDSQTGSDKAFVNAEFTALGSAVKKLGTQGVRHIWTMEFNPKAIAQGVVVSSTKDGLERAYKRHTKLPNESIQVCNFPFNNGELSQAKMEALEKEYSHDIKELHVSLFSGNGITGGPPENSQSHINKLYRRDPRRDGAMLTL